MMLLIQLSGLVPSNATLHTLLIPLQLEGATAFSIYKLVFT